MGNKPEGTLTEGGFKNVGTSGDGFATKMEVRTRSP